MPRSAKKSNFYKPVRSSQVWPLFRYDRFIDTFLYAVVYALVFLINKKICRNKKIKKFSQKNIFYCKKILFFSFSLKGPVYYVINLLSNATLDYNFQRLLKFFWKSKIGKKWWKISKKLIPILISLTPCSSTFNCLDVFSVSLFFHLLFGLVRLVLANLAGKSKLKIRLSCLFILFSCLFFSFLKNHTWHLSLSSFTKNHYNRLEKRNRS